MINKERFLGRLYTNMQSRVRGVQKNRIHLYLGKPILTRKEFYEWANGKEEFHTLFETYSNNGFKRMESPSVDRIKTDGGYTIGNMRFITTRENCMLGCLSRHKMNEDNGRINLSSNYKGVSWDKSRGKWTCYVLRGGRQISCGRHDNQEAAAKAVREKEIEIGG